MVSCCLFNTVISVHVFNGFTMNAFDNPDDEIELIDHVSLGSVWKLSVLSLAFREKC